MSWEFSIIEYYAERWIANITHDLSDYSKEKYPDVVKSVTIKYSLEAVDQILDK